MGFPAVRENETQFVVGESLLGFLDRFHMEDMPEQEAGRTVKKIDDRAEDDVEKPQRRAQPEDESDRHADRQRLRNKLPKQQVEVGDQ